MGPDLQTKYVIYKTLLRKNHLDSDTWVLNWDITQNKFADFGIGDSLFYTTIYLTALALEKNEPEFTSLLTALNQHRYAKGMYPRYRNVFGVSKDPYYTLILGLVYGTQTFKGNLVVSESLNEIIEGVQANEYHLKDPDGKNTEQGDMSDFKPVFAAIKGENPFDFWLSLWFSPAYSALINLARRSYFNNFMIANRYLILNACMKGTFARLLLTQSAKAFASVNDNNPYFLMVRDIVTGSRNSQNEVEKILGTFPEDHLPNEGDRITNSDVLWQIDPRDWETPNAQFKLEFSGIDYMILYQLYNNHYISG